jgi:hypothetical protein
MTERIDATHFREQTAQNVYSGHQAHLMPNRQCAHCRADLYRKVAFSQGFPIGPRLFRAYCHGRPYLKLWLTGALAMQWRASTGNRDRRDSVANRRPSHSLQRVSVRSATVPTLRQSSRVRVIRRK